MRATRRAYGRRIGIVVAASFASAGTVRAQDTTGTLTLESVVRITLARGPDILLARSRVAQSRGALDVARAAFDVTTSAYVLGARDRAPIVTPTVAAETTSTTASYGLGAQRRLGSGIVIKPQVDFKRVTLGGIGVADGPGLATASLSVTAPLQRGRGGGVVGAVVAAARIETDAARADLRQTAAGTALDAITAYWGYQAAAARTEARRVSEARAARLLEDTRALVRADERPASDLTQLEANVASKAAARLDAAQQLVEARHRLALAMGLGAREAAALGGPATPFPEPAPADTASGRGDGPAADAAAVADALGTRADVSAARQRRAASQRLASGASSELRPRVDLSVQVGYAGIDGGRALDRPVSAFYRNVAGPSASVQLSYELPWRNSEARGRLVQALVADEQSAIALGTLERTVASNVAVAIAGVASSAAQCERAGQAVTLYARSVENEQQRFRLGAATLFDVILAEDALTTARLAQADARQRYAVALARRQFEAGRLVADVAGELRTDPDAAWLLGGTATRR